MNVTRSTKSGAAVLALVLCVLSSFSAHAETRILCLGDSLTEGYGVEPEVAYPARLERRLKELGYSDVRVTNAGISGATTASAVSRLKWQMRASPEILILALGAKPSISLRGWSGAESRDLPVSAGAPAGIGRGGGALDRNRAQTGNMW